MGRSEAGSRGMRIVLGRSCTACGKLLANGTYDALKNSDLWNDVQVYVLYAACASVN